MNKKILHVILGAIGSILAIAAQHLVGMESEIALSMGGGVATSVALGALPDLFFQ